MRTLTCVTLSACVWTCAGAPASAQAVDDRRCLQCHGQERIATDSPEDLRVRVRVDPAQPAPPPRRDQKALYVTPESLKAGVHAGASCISCHADAADLPHAARLKPAQCGSCHADAADELLRSAHAEAAARGTIGAPTCGSCHGSHDIRRKSDPKSLTNPLNVINTCGQCHQKHDGASSHGHDGPDWVRSYLESVHGKAVQKSGLVVSATCSDCHGSHRILPSSDPESTVSHANVPRTCGRCHVGIQETFAASVHGKLDGRSAVPAGQHDGKSLPAPVCSDCHSSHAIARTGTPAFAADIVNECGTCHEELYRTYRLSYHGQVEQLGGRRAARCKDCHGTHNIRAVDDPLSGMAMAKRAETCATAGCHVELRDMSASARANFVRYAPHADHADRARHPILFYVWLYFLIVISITFTFWGLHTAAWLTRGTINRMRHGPRHHPPKNAAVIQRFNAWHRWTHVLVMTSFMGLTFTGIPLKFSDEPWARTLAAAFGGPESAGRLHRFFAVMVVVYMIMHAIHLWRTRKGGGSFLQRVFGPHSMMPTMRDWREFVQMTRWFLGRGEKPRFDRWTYWEKFDYWADAIGTGIIGLSGLMLWFPAFFAEYVSGYWFNVATLIHGYEALLAVGFIFTIHFFNAHLRWEKFPVDDVIFTGQLSEEEFREERGAQYDRLVAEGSLEKLRVKPAPFWQWLIARIVGILALAVGIGLVVLIVWASWRAG